MRLYELLGVALTGLLNTVFGAVTGPLLIALLTERIFRDPAQVGRSIALVVVPALLLGIAMFVIAARAAGEMPGQATGVRS